MLKKNVIGITVFIILLFFIVLFPYEGIFFQIKKISGGDPGISRYNVDSVTEMLIPDIVILISVVVFAVLLSYQLAVVIQTFSELAIKKFKAAKKLPEVKSSEDLEENV
ncbi:MAG TPA: hypothetical protein PKA90_14980 [Ignavibacteria bacterium]|nr:hypothetical protein [Ignavibacteria bacterium]HMR41721.1 hypothetical protein [Ignavibacteria bacterium]